MAAAVAWVITAICLRGMKERKREADKEKYDNNKDVILPGVDFYCINSTCQGYTNDKIGMMGVLVWFLALFFPLDGSSMPSQLGLKHEWLAMHRTRLCQNNLPSVPIILSPVFFLYNLRYTIQFTINIIINFLYHSNRVPQHFPSRFPTMFP